MNKAKIFLRSTAGNIFFYPALMIGLSLIVVIGIFSRKKAVYVWDNYIHPAIFKISLKLYGIEVEIRGEKYIKPMQIYASKHESAMETYLYTGVVKNSAFVMKKELTYVPIFGWAQAVYGMIPIDRGAGGKAMKGMLKEAKKRVEDGRSIVIFPEGTRCKHLEVKGYKPGIVFLSEGLNLPIVPVALNTGLHWPKSSYIKYPGKVVFEFMPPMHISDYKNKKEFMEELENRIETVCEKINF
jgi:1-acyl-sn-glycerol-3-phosphate acyltransferase